MHYIYQTKGTCARTVSFDLEEGNVIRNVQFQGGCNGNLKAVSALVEGLSAEQVEEKVKGIRCGFKDTSCADQLARAIRQALERGAEQA